MVRQKTREPAMACDLCGEDMLTEFPIVVKKFRYRLCRRCFNSTAIHDPELTS